MISWCWLTRITYITAACSSSYGSNESMNYDPSVHRKLEHPTSNIDTLIHLLKGNIGTGILAMPDACKSLKMSHSKIALKFHKWFKRDCLSFPIAVKNAGLYVGLFGTMIMGIICTHCMHMLVGCSHELCRRLQVPAMSFPEVCYNAFQTGPQGLRKFAGLARWVFIQSNSWLIPSLFHLDVNPIFLLSSGKPSICFYA